MSRDQDAQRDLLYVILSMDAYNRGYGAGLAGLIAANDDARLAMERAA